MHSMTSRFFTSIKASSLTLWLTIGMKTLPSTIKWKQELVTSISYAKSRCKISP
jgi:hypothetical protein